MSKVRLEAVMWVGTGFTNSSLCMHSLSLSALQGAGTAIGELPPYFMARAARLSGHEDEDPDYEEIEAVLHSQRKDPLTRAKKAVHRLVQRVGFFGILLCASVSMNLLICSSYLLPCTTTSSDVKNVAFRFRILSLTLLE